MITIGSENLRKILNDIDDFTSALKDSVQTKAMSGFPVHEVEKDILYRIFEIGAQALGFFLRFRAMEMSVTHSQQRRARCISA